MKKRMTKLISAAVIGAMALGLAACGSSADKSGTAGGASSAASSTSAETASVSTVEKGKLHMATNAQFPPYEMTKDDGGYEGIDVEIAEAIAKKLDLTLVVDDMDFSAVVTSVQSGKEDMAMAGLTVNDERKKNVDFTDTYAKAVQKIIVKKGSSIKTAKDLKKAGKIGVQEGTTGATYCTDDFGADHVTAYTNGATAVQALVSGKADAVVIDSEPAKEFVKNNDGLKILDSSYVEEEYAIGINKKNPELRKAINSALNELKKDGTVQKIIDKYITADETK
ncbi:MAG TPA: ABC transporter substrate-binding protein [Lachnospiraceae bacterium]|nr:ABC transporter substrate-binding protein [Lachnospiraceae bacterium]